MPRCPDGHLSRHSLDKYVALVLWEETMLVRRALREYRTWVLDSRYWGVYAPRWNDVIISTAPKCGTTWMQQIVGCLVFQDAEARPLPVVSPWVEARFRFTREEIAAILAKLPHRRFLKTHLPIDGLPLYDDVKYIHVARDGRDAVLSMHDFFTGFSVEQLARYDVIGCEDPLIGRPYERPQPDVAAYFRQWITTKPPRGPVEGPPSPHFFDIEAGYWAERKRPNILLVHYADLCNDVEAEMRRVADFLEIEVEDRLWPSLVRAAGFEAMRASGDTLMPQMKTMLKGGSKRFFNKGVSGRWRGVLSDTDLELYDARVRETLCPGLAVWLAGGRLKAGEPRVTPD
jgi:aryl sulfotransferase